MTIAYFCIVIAVFIPLMCAGFAKFSRKGYDNSRPREFLEGLEGKSKRAHYAQLNSFEAFAPFAAGVIVAHQLHAPQNTLDLLAVLFILLRLAYVFCYIYNYPAIRSIVWFGGFVVTIALFFIGG